MNTLLPLQSLFDNGLGIELPAPSSLLHLYGPLRFQSSQKPTIIANFVSTIDGIISIHEDGQPNRGGKEICGHNPHDRAVMGLLRAAADVVISTSGVLKNFRGLPLVGESVYPALTAEYHSFRQMLGKPAYPLSVIVTGKGSINPDWEMFKDPNIPILIVTTSVGAQKISALTLPKNVDIISASSSEQISIHTLIEIISKKNPSDLILIEGGGHFLGQFLAEKMLDELFLTLAPQIAGRGASQDRLSLVEGIGLAPHNACWGQICSVKKSESHLFLRYSFRS